LRRTFDGCVAGGCGRAGSGEPTPASAGVLRNVGAKAAMTGESAFWLAA
jgi:hypothetical protein